MVAQARCQLGLALALGLLARAVAAASPDPVPLAPTLDAAPNVSAESAESPAPRTPPKTHPSGPSSSVELEAERRRQRALRFWDLQSFRAAREEFRAAYQLVHHPVFLYNVAVTSMALGDSAGASDYFERYLAEGGRTIAAERRAMVEQQLQDLADLIATLDVDVDVAGAAILLDGVALGVSPLKSHVRLNAGNHTVTVRQPAGVPESRQLVLRGGQSLRLTFTLAQRERQAQAAGRRRRWLTVGWTGTAVLGVGAALAGWRALVAQHSYEDKLGKLGASRNELDRLDTRAARWSMTTDALTASAAAVGACSLYFTFKPPVAATESGQLELRLLPSGASVSGAF